MKASITLEVTKSKTCCDKCAAGKSSCDESVKTPSKNTVKSSIFDRSLIDVPEGSYL